MKTLILLFIATLVLLAPNNVHAYTVDGSVSDWGVDLSNPNALNRHYLDTHTPTSSSTVDYTTHDNAQQSDGVIYIGPGYSRGNTYDAEAMYFDNNAVKGYIAVVTGLAQNEPSYPAGDIFIDTGKYQNPLSPFYDPKKYQYAINISDSKLYEVTSWQDVLYYHASDPWRMGTGNFIENVPFVYSGNQNSHYVLESSFDLSSLNLKNGDTAYLQWTMYCGNSDLKLNGSVNVVPEPETWALLAIGLIFCAVRFRINTVV